MGICRRKMWEGLTMIRAIIGTVAVLAGFAVVENSSDASTGLASSGLSGSCKAMQVYAMLQGGEQVPVRSEPSPEAALLGTLSYREGTRSASPVTIVASQSGWARIALDMNGYTSIDGTSHDYGWVPADQLAVNSRIDGTVTVYDRPGLLGSAINRISNDDQKFRVLSCHDDLLQVINAKQGNVWIDRWCARPEGCRG